MIEIEIFLGSEAWTQSWLLSAVDISSETETYSGIITAESIEKIDHATTRCLFRVESQKPEPPSPFPSVITSNTHLYSDIKRLSPSAGTSLPIPESSELLVNFILDDPHQPIAIGSLYNKSKTDPVQTQNSTQHILRANPSTELLIDDENPKIQFSHQKNNITLTHDAEINNSTGNIVIHSKQNIHHCSQADTQETSEHNYTRMVHKNFTASTEIGSMEYSAEKNMEIKSTNNINLHSPPNIILKSNNNLDVNANLSLLSHQDIVIESDEIMAIHSGSDLTIIAENNIRLCLNNNIIEITKEGTINLNAPTITVSGQPILRVKPSAPT